METEISFSEIKRVFFPSFLPPLALVVYAQAVVPPSVYYCYSYESLRAMRLTGPCEERQGALRRDSLNLLKAWPCSSPWPTAVRERLIGQR